MKSLLLPAICIFINIASFGQVESVPVSEWVKRLKNPDDKKNETIKLLFDSIVVSTDTARMNRYVQQFEKYADNGESYLNARLKAFEAGLLCYKDYLRGDKASKLACMQLMKQAMHIASETNDEYLLAYVSAFYFSRAMFYGETELAVMYGIYSAELYEKVYSDTAFVSYHFLAELMYKVKEYEKCKDYSLKWLRINANTKNEGLKSYRMSVFNTAALAYHHMAKYDSAMYYYSKALVAAEEANRYDWKGIISGNMGQVFYLQKQYDTAIPLLDTDYHISTQYKYLDNALNALQWSARAYAAKGNGPKALQQFRAGMALINDVPDEGYLQNIYYAGVEVFKANGLIDSAMYYSGLYQKLHDSIEKNITSSSVAISNVRISEEKSFYNIRRMQQDKQVQQQQRNFIIAGIVLLAVISVLLINRQRVKLKYQQQTLEKEKQIRELEMVAAKQQMEMFTQKIVEKTSIIEKLELQMKENNSSAGQQETIAALSNLTILTEQEWEQFKELFEKMCPMFFQRLKTKAPDITVAEQRMAALTRMQLTTKQMAAMQGISPDSVHKTRQRLRQRLGLGNDTNLEEFFGSL